MVRTSMHEESKLGNLRRAFFHWLFRGWIFMVSFCISKLLELKMLQVYALLALSFPFYDMRCAHLNLLSS